ncbi:MAG: hypothetical protein ACXWB9_09045 [Flavisolibacter sp.]
MRKVILNKWFLLSAFLTLSLSAFSIVTYKKVRQTCTVSGNCSQAPSVPAEKGELLIDAVSRQFSSFIALP